MNVLKIVVDEMPESCRACKLHTVIPANFNVQLACFITGTINRKPNTRPTWCPLVVEVPEVCKWKHEPMFDDVFFRNPHYHERNDFAVVPTIIHRDYYKFCPLCGKPIKYVESE